jgi:hypothetical protein
MMPGQDGSMNTMSIFRSKSARRVPGVRLLLAGLLAAVLCGCVRYDVTETNGIKLLNVRKPVRSADGTYYTLKLGNGQTTIIPSSRVIYIVPHGDSNMVFRN